jgi:hypothetical protein
MKPARVDQALLGDGPFFEVFSATHFSARAAALIPQFHARQIARQRVSSEAIRRAWEAAQ